MKANARLHHLAFALAVTLGALAAAAGATQDDSAAAQARTEIGAELDELGETLRAAVMSGALTGEEAKGIYFRVAGATKAAYARDFGEGEQEAKEPPSPALAAARPEQMRVLLQAEFVRRDLQVLRDEMDLDRDQMVIAEALFADYARAYELAVAPLGEALAQYRSATMDSYIAFALEDAGVQLGAAAQNARERHREDALARTTEALARIDREKEEGLAAASDEDRARYDAWRASMITATGELDERLAEIRDRTTARLTDLGRTDAAIGAEDLAGMARQLRTDRTELRKDLAESLEMVATKAQRGEGNARFDATMARVRVGHLLPRGRFGGESMDLWAALTEASLGEGGGRARGLSPEYARVALEGRLPAVAAALDERSEATIEREIAGLELQALRDQIAIANREPVFEVDERRLSAGLRPYAQALRREVAASVAARDALLALLEESAALLDETYPDNGISNAYREAALRRGFRREMRQRWSERAIAAALGLDDLSNEVRAALLAIQSDTVVELQSLRNDAVAKRVRREPELAREQIDARFEDERRKVQPDAGLWRGMNYEAFASLDDRVERLLNGVLTPEQFESLPKRRRADGKDGGKSGAGGKGGGSGK